MAKKTTTKTKTDNKAATEGKVVTKRSQAVRKAIADASKSIETNHLNLAKLLHEAFTKEYAPQWGYADFEAFCAQEVGVGYRKARYMVDIWAKVSERKIPAAALSKIGWSKLKEICSVMGDAFNVSDEDLIKMANDMSLRDLTEEVKKMRSGGGTSRNPSTFKVTVQVGESANKVIMEALEEAKKIMEKDDTGLALEMICQDWLMEKGKVPERTDIKDFVAYLEDMYGVTITVKAKKGATNKVAAAQKEAAEANKATTGKAKPKAKAKAAEETKETTTGKAKPKAKPKAKAKAEATTAEQDDELDALLGGDEDGDGDLDAILGGDDEVGGDGLGLEDEFEDLGTDDQEIDDLLGLGSD